MDMSVMYKTETFRKQVNGFCIAETVQKLTTIGVS